MYLLYRLKTKLEENNVQIRLWNVSVVTMQTALHVYELDYYYYYK